MSQKIVFISNKKFQNLGSENIKISGFLFPQYTLIKLWMTLKTFLCLKYSNSDGWIGAW